MRMLHAIDGKHVLGALAIGVTAGIVWYFLDIYVVSRVETAVGVTPGNL